MERCERDVGGNPHARRARRDRAGNRHERREISVIDEVMLCEPHKIYTDFVCKRPLLEYPAIEFRVRYSGVRRITNVVCDAETQCVGHDRYLFKCSIASLRHSRVSVRSPMRGAGASTI